MIVLSSISLEFQHAASKKSEVKARIRLGLMGVEPSACPGKPSPFPDTRKPRKVHPLSRD